jgi:hypothetical protein
MGDSFDMARKLTRLLSTNDEITDAAARISLARRYTYGRRRYAKALRRSILAAALDDFDETSMISSLMTAPGADAVARYHGQVIL